jgi:hypothetical protein
MVRFEVFVVVTMKKCHLLGFYAMSLVRTDVSEECCASINVVTRIGELGTRATWHNIPEDGILQHFFSFHNEPVNWKCEI